MSLSSRLGQLHGLPVSRSRQTKRFVLSWSSRSRTTIGADEAPFTRWRHRIRGVPSKNVGLCEMSLPSPATGSVSLSNPLATAEHWQRDVTKIVDHATGEGGC